MHTMFRNEEGFEIPSLSNKSAVDSGVTSLDKLGILQTDIKTTGTLLAMDIKEDVSFATVVSREVLTFDYPTELPVNFPRLTFNGAQ